MLEDCGKSTQAQITGPALHLRNGLQPYFPLLLLLICFLVPVALPLIFGWTNSAAASDAQHFHIPQINVFLSTPSPLQLRCRCRDHVRISYPASDPSPNCCPVCRKLVRQFGDIRDTSEFKVLEYLMSRNCL
jgi:hypothetical protein